MREIFAKEQTHPSYGIISFNRVQGTGRSLFGSNIKHNNTIQLEISECRVSRQFQKAHYFCGKRIIEVEMSSTQFAEAITSLNCGQGIPVTLKMVNGESREETPEPDFQGTAKGELKKEMEELGERIEELSKDAKEILGRKGTPIKAEERKKILDDLMFLVQEVKSNIPFVHDCFEESVNETVVQAKAEIEATVLAHKEKLGEIVIESGLDKKLLKDK